MFLKALNHNVNVCFMGRQPLKKSCIFVMFLIYRAQ